MYNKKSTFPAQGIGVNPWLLYWLIDRKGEHCESYHLQGYCDV